MKWRNVLLACSLLCAGTSFSMDQSKIRGKLSRKLREDSNRFDVLVTLKNEADLSRAQLFISKEARGKFVVRALQKAALQSQSDLVEWLNAQNIDHKAFYITNSIAAYNVSYNQLSAISERADVKHIYSDEKIRFAVPQPTSVSDTATPEAVGGNVKAIGADAVWSEFGATGQGIVVAGEDTGVQWDHPALKNQYRGWNGTTADHNYSWHDAIRQPIDVGGNPCGYDTQAPCDDNDHGTHTIGTVAGDDGGENKIGVAPGAKWIACRNMDQGSGRPSSYIECFEFFLAPYPIGGNSFADARPEMAPHVINNSWACPPEEQCEGGEILPVVKALKEAGIMVVASAGNEGPSCATIGAPPATYTAETLSVGSINHRLGGLASTFSSRGPSVFDGCVGPDIVAPGENIRSAVRGGRYNGFFSGTSMAGPHVVGAVALLWSHDPSLVGNIDGTVEALRASATPKTGLQSCGGVAGDAIPNNTYGYGSLNIYEAVKRIAELKKK